MLLNLDACGTQINTEKEKPKGLHEFVNRSLMALEEAASDSF